MASNVKESNYKRCTITYFQSWPVNWLCTQHLLRVLKTSACATFVFCRTDNLVANPFLAPSWLRAVVLALGLSCLSISNNFRWAGEDEIRLSLFLSAVQFRQQNKEIKYRIFHKKRSHLWLRRTIFHPKSRICCFKTEVGGNVVMNSHCPWFCRSVTCGSRPAQSAAAYNWTFLVFCPAAKMDGFIKSNCPRAWPASPSGGGWPPRWNWIWFGTENSSILSITM